MSIPRTARQYCLLSQGDTYDNLVVQTKKVEEPRGDEVLVKIHAVSLQNRDPGIVFDRYFIKIPNNTVPCSDMAGEIVALGQDVTGWNVGDRVTANFAPIHLYGEATPLTIVSHLGGPEQGVLTEYRAFPTSSLVAVPEHLSYEEAATLPCAGVAAYNSLFGTKAVKAGDYVLVLGTGGVATFGLQFGVAAGAVVIATSSSDAKLEVARKLGARHVINYHKTPNWDQEVMKITNGAGVDHVIEIGGLGTIAKSINSTRMGGRVNIVGFLSKEENNSNIPLDLLKRAVHLRGIRVGNRSQFEDLMRLLAAHPETTCPVIDKIFSFEDAIKAYEYLTTRQHIGKVVIKVSED